MYTSTYHSATPTDKNAHDRMNFQKPLSPSTSQHAVFTSTHASLAYTPSHTGDDSQTCWYWCTFEVFAFSGCVFGQGRDGNVEAG